MGKLLMVSYFSPPELNAESILVGKTIAKLAHSLDIDLITAGGLNGKQDQELARLSDSPNINRIIIESLQKPKWWGNGSFRDSIWYRYVDKIWEYRASNHPEVMGSYDYIYSRSQPGISHIVAQNYKRSLGIPWVAQFSDPWANNPYHKHGQRRMSKIEERIVQDADALVFPTREICELYHKAYPDAQVLTKGHILPHCYDESLFPVLKRSDSPKLVMSYIGDFYGLRSPEALLRGLSLAIMQRPELKSRLEIRIWGYVEPRFLNLIHEFSDLSEMVKVHGQVSYLESLEEMNRSDVLLLVDAVAKENIFLSSKLIDYFGSRRPILGITPMKGTAADYLRHFQFPVCDPLDYVGISSKVLDLIDEIPYYKELAERNDYSQFQSGNYAKEIRAILDRLKLA